MTYLSRAEKRGREAWAHFIEAHVIPDEQAKDIIAGAPRLHGRAPAFSRYRQPRTAFPPAHRLRAAIAVAPLAFLSSPSRVNAAAPRGRWQSHSRSDFCPAAEPVMS
ncbi:hypothetical protein H6P81_008783 [Aristolochia fimbriata]|uniref:Uncharacterized protein n=1 Tax=Aristolochia fimbriata TaxID=158543 RepID=A0AAV7ENK1_ARIFI|nr:hypothetical protein H6P81_008783 [Aristolochia fimbriata]